MTNRTASSKKTSVTAITNDSMMAVNANLRLEATSGGGVSIIDEVFRISGGDRTQNGPAAHGQSVSLVQHLNRASLGETLGDPRLGGGSHAGEQVRLGGKASHPFGQHHSVARGDDKSAMAVRAHNFRNRADRGDDDVFFFQAEDGIRVGRVTGVQTCALPI